MLLRPMRPIGSPLTPSSPCKVLSVPVVLADDALALCLGGHFVRRLFECTVKLLLYGA